MNERDGMQHSDWPQRGVTRRAALSLLAGGLGALAAADAGLARNKRRKRGEAGRVGAESRPAATRNINEFVDAQGTTTDFVPPVPDVVGWTTPFDRKPLLFAWVDYPGGADGFQGLKLGTKFAGSVIERRRADGRADVRVILATTNALAWVIELDLSCVPPPGDDFTCVFEQIANTTPIFGYRPQEAVAPPKPKPSLVTAKFDLEFINTEMGAPLPDLVTVPFAVDPDRPDRVELVSVDFRATGIGTFRATGGRARLDIWQVGKDLNTPDGVFTKEQIEVRRLGR